MTRGSDGAGSGDAVEIKAALQGLAGLQWSRDGKEWTDVTPQTLIEAEQMDTIGVRALKRVPDADWPDAAPLGPTWTWQGQTLTGETLWLHAAKLTANAGEMASATLDKTLAIPIKVVPGDALITYDTP